MAYEDLQKLKEYGERWRKSEKGKAYQKEYMRQYRSTLQKAIEYLAKKEE